MEGAGERTTLTSSSHPSAPAPHQTGEEMRPADVRLLGTGQGLDLGDDQHAGGTETPGHCRAVGSIAVPISELRLSGEGIVLGT